jgi:hypothetical protein
MIIVVSGLPRSGTSLMMQMLAAAEVPIQQDGVRAPDASNERGYFEWERIKQLPREPGLILECQGKAVKVISSLLMSLPQGPDYRIVFVERDLDEVLASQTQMIERLGTRGGRLAPELMRKALETHRNQVHAWLVKLHGVVLKVAFAQLIGDPSSGSENVARFLGLGEEQAARMAGVVDVKLRHHGPAT